MILKVDFELLAWALFLEIANDFWLGIRTDPKSFWDGQKPPSDILYYLFIYAKQQA